MSKSTKNQPPSPREASSSKPPSEGQGKGAGDKSSKNQTPSSKQAASSELRTPNPELQQQEGRGEASIIRWLGSKTVRHATAMGKHVRKILNHQRDVLSPQAVENITAANDALRQALANGADKPALEKEMEKLETAAGKWLKPYPNAALRENIEVLLVALTVAMGIRTFFLQPFKIPTGSMQPTLFGVTSVNLVNQPDFKFPTGLERIKQWFEGISYVHVVAENDGTFDGADPPVRFLIFNIKQTLSVGGKPYTIWFPPDFGSGYGGTLQYRAELEKGRIFHAGEDIVRLRVQAGDHLFVDRVTYNFRPPIRGEIIVFDTHGIDRLSPDQQDTFYIKRLVGLGGETLSLKKDHAVTGSQMGTQPVGHLVVDGHPITAADPHFTNLYSYDGAPPTQEVIPYRENHYFGHAMLQALVASREFHVGPHNYFVMGDNTFNSSDSRYWGDFPQSKVIGKSFFVYWPITERFGWGYYR